MGGRMWDFASARTTTEYKDAAKNFKTRPIFLPLPTSFR
jgi:hypothetical protein